MRRTVLFHRGVIALSLCALAPALSGSAAAQSHRDLHRAADAAIVSDIARDRQAERDARRQPYVSPGYGGGYGGEIHSASAASDACSAKALEQAGPGAKILGRPVASTMSTGWEVEGSLGPIDDRSAVPFTCSVRSGAVSGILLHQDR